MSLHELRRIDNNSNLQDDYEASMWQQSVSNNINILSDLLQSGNGAPTHVASNGTIYMRLDGGTGTTMYVREAGSWVTK